MFDSNKTGDWSRSTSHFGTSTFTLAFKLAIAGTASGLIITATRKLYLLTDQYANEYGPP